MSIVDFGTGYSSLAYLNRFPIDKLKIDQSFVRDMLDGPANLAIVRATIALGHTLGLSIVAEGVELLAQADQLTQQIVMSCKGFYFSRPLTAQDLARWLDRGQRPLKQRKMAATLEKPTGGEGFHSNNRAQESPCMAKRSTVNWTTPVMRSSQKHCHTALPTAVGAVASRIEPRLTLTRTWHILQAAMWP